jgi:hypothetical protein
MSYENSLFRGVKGKNIAILVVEQENPNRIIPEVDSIGIEHLGARASTCINMQILKRKKFTG